MNWILPELENRIASVQDHLDKMKQTRDDFMRLAHLTDAEIEYNEILLVRLQSVLPLAKDGDFGWIDRLKEEGDRLLEKYGSQLVLK